MKAGHEDPFIGRVLESRFEITELVGRGGMSDVYRAHHTRAELTVAVKIMKAEFAYGKTNLERFKREAAIVNNLFHPNIIRIYSYDVLENGQAYMVLDFLKGESLADRIQAKGRVDPDSARQIFIQVCRGVGHAHEAGLLHRDLKPANVMLVDEADPDEWVKIVDFGISKPMPGDAGYDQGLTQAGEIFGSPLYMSPEQCTGAPLDQRSDIYSMGCLMFEALTGRPPFKGPHALATMSMHLNERAQRLSEAAPELSVPEAIENAVMQALSKNPGDRQQSMSEIESQIQ